MRCVIVREDAVCHERIARLAHLLASDSRILPDAQ
jgi:hypothetical protein